MRLLLWSARQICRAGLPQQQQPTTSAAVGLLRLRGGLVASLATAPSPVKNQKPNLNVGTIGHIDHGKTTLSAAITHVQSKRGLAKPIKFDEIDKAKEEKKRGITINIAHIAYESATRRFSHTDCPGHADFIKNMICGTAQMDVAVLVIAATEGTMAQTKEHILLARQIGVRHVIVFINKADLVEDGDLLDLVEIEARELLIANGYDGDAAAVIRGSALQALEGGNTKCIDELMAALEAIPQPERHADQPFLMPIASRVSITGRGTVIVGTIEQGALKKGDKIEISGESHSLQTIASDLHVFGNAMKEVKAGDHCGILCRGLKQEAVERGMWAGALGSIKTTNRFRAELYMLSEAESGRKSGVRTGFTDKIFCTTWDQVGRFEWTGDSELLMPGEHCSPTVWMPREMPLREGLSFTVRASSTKQTIARGRVGELLPPAVVEKSLRKTVENTEKREAAAAGTK